MTRSSQNERSDPLDVILFVTGVAPYTTPITVTVELMLAASTAAMAVTGNTLA